MIRLFIDEKEVEMDSATTVALTFQVTDYTDPTAVKNSFSKTVELPGTQVNNDIFGHIYKLDRTVIENEDNISGVNFDARKRVPFVLYDDSDMIEKGYIKLDTIKKANNVVTYNITLFGGLGDFFYNLAYNDNDEGETDKTLADLYFKFLKDDGEVYAENDEKTKDLFKWNKDYIYNSWNWLKLWRMDETDKPKYPNAYITAAPTFQGVNDDFENSKVLVNYNSGTSQYFPESKLVEGKFYGTRGNYGMVELPRECVEHEVRDLRSNQQRPAIKTSLILDAICDPDNNGGYEVQFPSMEKGDDLWAYYHKSYMLLDKLDFEDSDNNSVTPLYLNGTGINLTEAQFPPDTGGSVIQASEWLGTQASGITFDLSGMTMPKMEINIQPQITWSGDSLLGGGKPTVDKMYLCHDVQDNNHVSNGIIYWVQIMTETTADSGVFDREVSISKRYIMSTPYDDSKNTLPFGKISDIDNLIATKIGCDAEDIVFLEGNLQKQSDNGLYFFDSKVKITQSLPKDVKFRIKLNARYIHAQMVEGQKSTVGDYILGYGNSGKGYYGNTVECGIVNDEDYSSGIYDGTVSPMVQKMNVNKQVLLGGTSSPFDFLTSFTKMFNLRYRIDKAIPKIYIERINEYYKPEIDDINDVIDRGQEIIITPTLAEEKWYLYGLETPETYAQHIYAIKNKTDYGTYKFNTGYNFNSETNELFENNIFKNIIPYRLQSAYFNNLSDNPNITNLNYTYTLFQNWDGTTRADGDEYSMVMANDKVNTKKAYSNSFLCLFDSGNANVDSTTGALCFFDGFYSNLPYILTDNIQAMYDIVGDPCYLYTTSEYGYASVADAEADTEGNGMVKIAIKVTNIPKFTKFYQGYSLDFVKPNYVLDGTDDNTYKDLGYIYNLHWKKYVEDLYSKDSKSVELMMRITEQPQDMMRRFYLFDNTVWVMYKITDYNPNSYDLTKVEFVKVDNVQNYVNYSFADLMRRKINSTVDDVPEVDPSGYYFKVARNSQDIVPYTGGSITVSVESYRTFKDGTKGELGFNVTEIDGCAVGEVQNLPDYKYTVTLIIDETSSDMPTQFTATFLQNESNEERVIKGWQDGISVPVDDCYSVKNTMWDGSVVTDYFFDGIIPNAYYKNRTDMRSSYFGDCITQVGDSAYEGSGIKNVSYSFFITSTGVNRTIGINVFKNCKQLDSLSFLSKGRSMKTIPYGTFDGCSSLKYFQLMSGYVLDIGDYAFANCTSLSYINFYGNKYYCEATLREKMLIYDYTLGEHTFDNTNLTDCGEEEITYTFTAEPTSVDFTKDGGSINVKITSIKHSSKTGDTTQSWSRTQEPSDWVTYNFTSVGELIFQTPSNSGVGRNTSITLKQYESNKTITIPITQDGISEEVTYTFTASPTSIEIPQSGGTTGVTVTSTKHSSVYGDSDTEWEIDIVPDWCTATKTSTGLSLTFNENTGETLTGSITLRQDSTGNIVTIGLSQVGSLPDMGCNGAQALLSDGTYKWYDAKSNNELGFPYNNLRVIKAKVYDCVTRLGTDTGYEIVGEHSHYYVTYAFAGCENMVELILPDTLTYIENVGVLSGCESLLRVNSDIDGVINLPTSLTHLGYSAFRGSTSIEKMYYNGNSLTYLGNIPPMLKSLNSDIDGECIIPECVEAIGSLSSPNITTLRTNSNAPSRCGFTNLEYAYFNGVTVNRVVGTENNGYEEDNNTLTTVVFGNNVTTISDYAFRKCTALTNVDFGNGVTVGKLSFADCNIGGVVDLRNITFGEVAFKNNPMTDVLLNTDVPLRCFSFCVHLTTVHLSKGVTSIYTNAFLNCSNLSSVWFKGVEYTNYDVFKQAVEDGGAEYYINISDDAFDGTPFKDAPVEGYNVNLTFSGGTTRTDTFATGIIPSYKYQSNSGITGVVIENSITTIGKQAFLSCYNMTSLTLPSALDTIGNSAFRNCHGLTQVTIPDNVTSIGDYAFQNSTNLLDVNYRGIGRRSKSALISALEANGVTVGTDAFQGTAMYD